MSLRTDEKSELVPEKQTIRSDMIFLADSVKMFYIHHYL